jgi:Phosphatidylinositol N-acetylglucosaminyltransferase subunit Y
MTGGTPLSSVTNKTMNIDSDKIVDDRHIIRLGWCLMISTCILFPFLVYIMFVSKLVPKTGHAILDWISEDTYYTLLLPQTVIATIATVWLNWTGLKLFRHN